jgi:hypothetical protein
MNEKEWGEIWEIFHHLWGQSKDKIYDKPRWNELREKLAAIERKK